MLEPIGLIAMLDRLGRASRAQSTRCVYGLILWYRYRVHLYITSSRATIQARVRKLRGFCGQRPALEAARGNPPPPPGPPGKRRQSKAALRGRERGRAAGRPSYFQGPRTQIYPFRFTSIRVSAFTEKQEAPPQPRPPQPESTCYLPRRGICNQSWIRGERRPVPHSSRVGSQITGCSNLYPLHAPQRVSEIWLPVFTVPCFTVNKRAH
jgi:hypothetical protein